MARLMNCQSHPWNQWGNHDDKRDHQAAQDTVHNMGNVPSEVPHQMYLDEKEHTGDTGIMTCFLVDMPVCGVPSFRGTF